MVRGVAIVAFAAMLVATAAPASAEPDPAAPGGATPVAAADGAAPGVDPAALSAVPIDDGKVVSTPPATTTAPDGSALTISAKDETQMAVAPLTTAISSRAYVVGGVFTGSITGSAAPEGIFEVGYQIGCGIDMSTSGGVLIGGNAQVALGSDALLGGVGGFILPPIGIVGAGVGANAIVGVNLKPGIINNVPVTKKTYKGAAPEAVVSNFRVKIDGCVGESFIRSYATLANSTAEAEDIVSWFGVTTVV
jgi:hypothetical protein